VCIIYCEYHQMSKQNMINDKYRWILLLHALGDTIGFKNGDWEFNYNLYENLITLDYVNEMIYEFIELGGVNGIDLKGWKISDDTLIHYAIGKALLRYNGEVTPKFITNVKTQIHQVVVEMLDEVKLKKFDRRIGDTTKLSAMRFTDSHDARNDEYNDVGGGNGCAMRCLVIGMCVNGEKNRFDLINLSIITSQITHNNPLGYLGGLTSALFTALAIELVPVEEWPFHLIDCLKTNEVKQHIDMKNMDCVYDYGQYIRYWKKYIDTRFIDKKPIRNKSISNPLFRIRYYHDNFFKDTNSTQIGGSGYLCMIMAYDALLDCGGHWEKLIFYSILHSGDSDTIGAVAGGLYGAVYGQGDVPEHMLDNLEKKNELIELANDLYKKFNPNDRLK